MARFSMPESAVRKDRPGINVQVRRLRNNGDGTTTVRVADRGVWLQPDSTHTVPTDQIQRRDP